MRWLAYVLLWTGLDFILIGAASFWFPVLIGTWNGPDFFGDLDGRATHHLELAHGHVAHVQEDIHEFFPITTINLFAVAAPLLALGIYFLWPLPWFTRLAGHCRCGYNLTGNTSGICPECGAAVVRSTPDAPRSA